MHSTPLSSPHMATDTDAADLADSRQSGLQQLGALAGQTGQNIVELAGALEEIDRQASAQLSVVEDVSHQAEELARVSTEMTDGLAAVAHVNSRALDTVDGSVAALRQSTEQSKDVAEWVGTLDGTLAAVEETLKSVQKANRRIAEIAKQVNILAVNARIEAARAGDAGRGFAVVAEAINTLSKETAGAAQDVTNSTGTLGAALVDLRADAVNVTQSADAVLEGSSKADSALSQISADVKAATDDALQVSRAAQDARTVINRFRPAFAGLSATLAETADEVHKATQRAETIVDISEYAVQVSVQMGASTADGALIELVQDRAAMIGAKFEAAIEAGHISEAELFDRTYVPIHGTDPEQVMAPFTALTDALLPPIQEAILKENARIIFCSAVDLNGYLPTHNRKFSHPQGPDPVWNAANCRNRRLFDDRVGLKAGRNTAPFLMQTYRRDMGGGAFVLMKDLSAPIHVCGRHWGGLRMGVTPQD